MKATEHKRLVVGLCDDEEYVCDSVYKILKNYGNEHQIEIEFIYYNSAKLLLEKRDMLDVLFLDIEMPKMDGIKAGMKLRDWNIDYKIIMPTVREDRFRDAFKIGAFRFVSKPINEVEFCLAINDVIDAMSINRSVIAYRDNVAFEISQKDILYIEANSSSSLIYTRDCEYRSEQSLKAWSNLLDKRFFFQSHRSYIVNMSKIENVQGNTIYLVTGDRILVSRRLRTSFLKAYMMYDTRWR